MRGLVLTLAAMLVTAAAWGAQPAAEADVHAMFDQAERDARLARKTRPSTAALPAPARSWSR